MTKKYNSISHVNIGLLCVILLLESSVLGNAFVYYSGFPRYVPFFVCAGLAFLIAFPARWKGFSYLGFFLGLLALTALISDFFFSLQHKLFVVKMLVLVAMVNLCINDFVTMQRTLGRTFLHLSNAGILLGLSAILLPESLVFDSSYVDVLRRQGEGYGNTFYWSKNFSGLFLIGDDPNPLPFIGEIPRYGGYYNEPAVNGFYLCLSLALLYNSGYKFTKPVIILTAINLMISFSITTFACFALVFGFWVLHRSKKFVSIMVAFVFILILIFSMPFLAETGYVQQKLGGSLTGSTDIWRGILNSHPSYSSSLNARVGEFNFEKLNMFSVIFWMSLLTYTVILFLLGLFVYQDDKFRLNMGLSGQSVEMWVLVLIVFSMKSLGHYLFMPIIFVLMAQMMFVNRRKSLEVFE
jgi:hypothetical protein